MQCHNCSPTGPVYLWVDPQADQPRVRVGVRLLLLWLCGHDGRSALQLLEVVQVDSHASLQGKPGRQTRHDDKKPLLVQAGLDRTMCLEHQRPQDIKW